MANECPRCGEMQGSLGLHCSSDLGLNVFQSGLIVADFLL